MPSKLTAILAVGGLAIITANEGSGLHSLVQNHGVALLVEAENQTALDAGIQRALSSIGEMDEIRSKARQYATTFLDRNQIMKRYVKEILNK